MQHTQFDRFTQFLHWSMVALLLSQWLLAEYAEYIAGQDKLSLQLQILALHKSFGITILLLLLVRAWWRLLHPHPSWPTSMPVWQRQAARVAHYLFYGLILALPLTGWLGSSASAYTVSWFGIFQLPDLVQPDPELKKALYVAHEWIWNVLLVLIILHVLAALKHYVLDKDGVLQSMLRRFGMVIFVVTIVATALFVYWSLQPDKGSASASLIKSELSPKPEISAEDLPKAWRIDYANSYIRFVGDQAGAEFAGEFKQWVGRIHIQPMTDKPGFIDVSIDLASVDTQDEERDGLLLDAEFFDVQQFPTARFVSPRFNVIAANLEQGILFDASLSIRGLQAPLPFKMSIKQQGDHYVLIGEAVIDRLAWRVGIGEWEDVSTIGQNVKVMVRVVSH